MFNPIRPLTHGARHVANKAGLGMGFRAAAGLPGMGMLPGGNPFAGPAPKPRGPAASPTDPPETSAIMAAIEIWVRGADGKWSQRTDAVRLYPLALFMQYREESIAAIQGMRPAVLRIWSFDRIANKWNVEVHNAS